MRSLWAVLLDLAVVVLVGRGSHDEGNALVGFLATWWPFALGTLVGWAASGAAREPLSILPTGLTVWVATVAVGMTSRWAIGDGTPWSFIAVTSVFLGVFMLGWRAVGNTVLRVRRARGNGSNSASR